MMQRFDVFELPDGSYRAIKYGFNWPSLFFTWIWCFFFARLYGWGIVWIGVFLISSVLGGVERQLSRTDPGAGLVLSLIDIAAIIGFGIYFSYNANDFRRRKFSQIGYPHVLKQIEAPNRDQAISLVREDNQKIKEGGDGLQRTSTEVIPNVEDTLKELEKSLDDLTALKAKNVLSDAEFEEAKARAQEAFEAQKELAEQLTSETELKAELDNNLADLTALHQQGVLDSSAYEAAKERLFKTFNKKGIEGAVLHNGVIIERHGDKYVVDGRKYNSVDSAKAYIDHYKN